MKDGHTNLGSRFCGTNVGISMHQWLVWEDWWWDIGSIPPFRFPSMVLTRTGTTCQPNK